MDNLISKIIGGNVAVEANISKYLQTQGVVVRVSVGGGRNSYYVSPKMYGVVEEKLSEDSNEFLSQHVKNGRISLLREEDEKHIRNIEARVKKRLKEISIGYGDAFVPLSSFPEFKEYFEDNKAKFFDFRDNLVDRYEAIRERFVNIARSSVREMNAVEGERELEAILSRLPSKAKFRDSFKMEMSVSAFPTTENLDMFDDEIRKEILGGANQDESNLLLESVILTITEAYSVLSSATRSFTGNGKLQSRVILGLKNGLKRMSEKNIAGNERLEKLRGEIEGLLTMEADEAAGYCEYLIADLYKYAKEIGVDNRVDFEGGPFTILQLEDMILANA